MKQVRSVYIHMYIKKLKKQKNLKVPESKSEYRNQKGTENDKKREKEQNDKQ